MTSATLQSIGSENPNINETVQRVIGKLKDLSIFSFIFYANYNFNKSNFKTTESNWTCKILAFQKHLKVVLAKKQL